MAQIKVVSNIKGNILEWDRVVWGDRGQPFCFKVSPFGTAIEDQVITETGDIDGAALKVLIDQLEGVVRENNPKHADVTTDSSTAVGGGTSAGGFDATGDGTTGDGVNEGTRYGWCREGQLYTATVV